MNKKAEEIINNIKKETGKNAKQALVGTLAAAIIGTIKIIAGINSKLKVFTNFITERRGKNNEW